MLWAEALCCTLCSIIRGGSIYNALTNIFFALLFMLNCVARYFSPATVVGWEPGGASGI